MPGTIKDDLFDRLDVTQYADLSLSNFDYDKNSNLIRNTTPSGKPIEYAYDALNRLTTKTYPLTPDLNTTYTYDLGSRLTDADNTASQVHNNYDALNRVTGTTQILYSLSPLPLDYQYDNAGNRTQLAYPGGKTLAYAYDANDRLSSIKHQGSGFVNYIYDPLDRRTQKSYLSTSLPLTSYDYDIANQLTSVTNTLVNGTPISQYGYPLYDQVGNRKQLDRTLQIQQIQSTQYSYNNIYELTSVSGAQTNSYDYDGVGNREVADGTIYTANNLNQYTNVGGTTHLYDANGNLTSNGSNTYTYDEQNRLSSYSSLITSASYQYDALNRRVAKTVGGITTYFVYDGDEIIADYNGTGTITAEYIHGDDIDEVLAMERGGNSYYYNYDGLGSVTELTDATGSIVENYTYDSYGNPSVVNSAIGNRYRFTGREFDEESEIYHYRARAYNSMIGRFLQRDPIGYEDGMNLFEYAHNSPTNFVDPDGEFAFLALIPLAYATFEIGLSALDAYSTGSTLLDPCASGGQKATSAGLFIVGALAPGGGYSTAGKAIQNAGRAGKQARLKSLLNDPTVSKVDKGWIKQEINSINRDNRTTIRVPPTKELAHRRGMEAKRGFGYEYSDLQDIELHKFQDKFEGY